MTVVTQEQIPGHYDVIRAEPIERLHGTLYDLVHQRTGARHLHLAVPDRNNYLCALYRTPPDDSTGSPHIMEHCVSGGSRLFPPGAGGDMYTRSLLTDVNGMTSADYTTFYIATRNHTDYMNWIDYIVDVTLHPRMELDTFLRHRGHFEFADPLDASTDLRFVGTVYNEMKAPFGAPARHAFGALTKAVFPGHTYANYAAGDPADMPGLTYDDILAFFRRFYHPAAANFISRGDVPLADILGRVETVVGEDAERREVVTIPEIPRVESQVVAAAPLPVGTEDPSRGHVILGWVCQARSADSYDRLVLEIATEVALVGPDAPVRREIEASGLVGGTIDVRVAPYQRHLVAISCADTDPASAPALFATVMRRLFEVVHNGLDASRVDDAIARLELRRRSNSTGVFLETVIPPLLYGGDPFTALEFDADLARLQDARRSGRPLEDALRRELVDNAHRALVVLTPDETLEQRVVDAENAFLAGHAATLTDADRAEIMRITERLSAPANVDLSDWPKRGLSPDEGLTILETPDGEVRDVGGVDVELFDQPTDGITHLWLRIDAAGIDDELVGYLGPLTTLLARGAGTNAGRADALRVAGHTRTDPSGDRTIHWLELSGRALVRDQHELAAAVRGLLTVPDTASLDGVIAESVSRLEQGIMPNAQVHLRRLAGGVLRRSAWIDDATKGLGQLRFLKSLARERTGDAAEKLVRLHDMLIGGGRIGIGLAGAAADLEDLLGPLSDALAGLRPGTPGAAGADRLDPPYPHRARIAQLPVAFTCEAIATPGLDHPDAAAIGVLGQLMFSGYLNTEIRRGGAYGVDYEMLPERGLYWISSRRDPLPDNTYRAFTEALDRFREGRWNSPGADDGKLAILRVTDPVDTPASASRRAWLANWTGHTTDAWNTFRRRVLDVTDDDVARVAKEYFSTPARATLVGRSMLEASADVAGLFDETEEA